MVLESCCHSERPEGAKNLIAEGDASVTEILRSLALPQDDISEALPQDDIRGVH